MLARFAATLTAEPWSVANGGRGVVAEFAEHGFDEGAIEAAIAVVMIFNYLTRVADATGIEFDYTSPLPAFEPDHEQKAAVRPGRDEWPVVGGELRTFPRFAGLSQALGRWREYVFEADEPLSRRERQLLARVAAEESCDRWRADELADHQPAGETDELLVGFGRKLGREPWRMRPADLDELRAAGFAETAILHVIAVVALQSAESRLAMGRAVTA